MAKGGRRDGAGRPKGALQATTKEDYESAQRYQAELAVEVWEKIDRDKRGSKPPKDSHDASMQSWIRQANHIEALAIKYRNFRAAASIHEMLGERLFGKVRVQVEHGGIEDGVPISVESNAPGLHQVEFADGTILYPAGILKGAGSSHTSAPGTTSRGVRRASTSRGVAGAARPAARARRAGRHSRKTPSPPAA